MLASAAAADGVAQTIMNTITSVMNDRGLDTASLDEAAKLVDTLGLKSMDIAEIVLLLEDELEIDPFQAIPITSVRTVGDLINAYHTTLDPAAGTAEDANAQILPPEQATARRAGRRR